MPGPRPKRREQDRELALAYLAVASVDEVRLDRVIDEHIERVMVATDQNLSLTADLLGMHRRSLQRYVRRKQQRGRRKKSAAAKRGRGKRRGAKRGGAKRGGAKRRGRR